jgi:hypothetical protein
MRESISRGYPWEHQPVDEHIFGYFDLLALLRGLHYLHTCDIWKDPSDHETREALWRELGAEITAEHIKRCPGERPYGWWIHDAPEMRRPIGRECFRHTDCDGSHIQDGRLPAFADPNCPEHAKKNHFGKPNAYDGYVYESELEYLCRLGLLSKAEKSLVVVEA